MKRAKFLNLLIASLLVAFVGAGCKKNPKNITHIPGSQQNVRPSTDLGPMRTPGTGNTVGLDNPRGSGLNDLGGSSNIAAPIDSAEPDYAPLAAETVHFEFDRAAVKPSEMPKVERVATYMKSTPGVQLLIAGHCDERGTEEYNRALGERRAIAVREVLLQKHGIESARVTTVSFGEDKPVSLEKTEEAYAKNRRAEFGILRPR